MQESKTPTCAKRYTCRMKRDVVQPGQESVWDYPRPPRIEPVKKRITIVFDGMTIADTVAHRVLETSHPPVYYIPESDIRMEHASRADPSASGRDARITSTSFTAKSARRKWRGDTTIRRRSSRTFART